MNTAEEYYNHLGGDKRHLNENYKNVFDFAERYANYKLRGAAAKAREEMLNCEPTPGEMETFILNLQTKDQ